MVVYCGLIAVFILLELALAKPAGPRPGSGKRQIVNFALLFMGFGLLALFPLGTAAASLLASERGWGLFNSFDAHPVIMLAAAILVHTFLAYWMHRLMHSVPAFWRLHRVHHSDPSPDLSTGVRHHPLELLMAAPVYYAGVIALGLPVWAALLAHFILLAGALLKHLDGSLPNRVERILRPVIATPCVHRVHHSSRPVETDSNFGNLLIVWDRVFGTYTEPRPEGPRRTGLGDEHDAISGSLAWQLRLAVNEPPQASPKLGKNSHTPV